MMMEDTAMGQAGDEARISTTVAAPLLYLTRGQLQTVAAVQDFWLRYCHQTNNNRGPQPSLTNFTTFPFSLKGALVLSQSKLHVIRRVQLTKGGGWVVEVMSRTIPLQDTCDTAYPDLDPEQVADLCTAYDQAVARGDARAVTVEQVERIRFWLMRLNQAVPHINGLFKAEKEGGTFTSQGELKAVRHSAVQATRQALQHLKTPEETQYLQAAIRACLEASAEQPSGTHQSKPVEEESSPVTALPASEPGPQLQQRAERAGQGGQPRDSSLSRSRNRGRHRPQQGQSRGSSHRGCSRSGSRDKGGRKRASSRGRGGREHSRSTSREGRSSRDRKHAKGTSRDSLRPSKHSRGRREKGRRADGKSKKRSRGRSAQDNGTKHSRGRSHSRGLGSRRSPSGLSVRSRSPEARPQQGIGRRSPSGRMERSASPGTGGEQGRSRLPSGQARRSRSPGLRRRRHSRSPPGQAGRSASPGAGSKRGRSRSASGQARRSRPSGMRRRRHSRSPSGRAGRFASPDLYGRRCSTSPPPPQQHGQLPVPSGVYGRSRSPSEQRGGQLPADSNGHTRSRSPSQTHWPEGHTLANHTDRRSPSPPPGRGRQHSDQPAVGHDGQPPMGHYEPHAVAPTERPAVGHSGQPAMSHHEHSAVGHDGQHAAGHRGLPAAVDSRKPRYTPPASLPRLEKELIAHLARAGEQGMSMKEIKALSPIFMLWLEYKPGGPWNWFNDQPEVFKVWGNMVYLKSRTEGLPSPPAVPATAGAVQRTQLPPTAAHHHFPSPGAETSSAAGAVQRTLLPPLANSASGQQLLSPGRPAAGMHRRGRSRPPSDDDGQRAWVPAAWGNDSLPHDRQQQEPGSPSLYGRRRSRSPPHQHERQLLAAALHGSNRRSRSPPPPHLHWQGSAPPGMYGRSRSRSPPPPQEGQQPWGPQQEPWGQAAWRGWSPTHDRLQQAMPPAMYGHEHCRSPLDQYQRGRSRSPPYHDSQLPLSPAMYERGRSRSPPNHNTQLRQSPSMYARGRSRSPHDHHAQRPLSPAMYSRSRSPPNPRQQPVPLAGAQYHDSPSPERYQQPYPAHTRRQTGTLHSSGLDREASEFDQVVTSRVGWRVPSDCSGLEAAASGFDQVVPSRVGRGALPGHREAMRQQSSAYVQHIVPYLERAGERGMGMREITAVCPMPAPLLAYCRNAYAWFRGHSALFDVADNRVFIAGRWPSQ